MKPPDALRSQILEAVRHAPAPGRREVERRRWQTALLLPTTLVLGFPLRRDAHALPLVDFAATVALAMLLALVATLAATRRGRFGLGTPASWMTAIGLATPAAYALITALWPLAPANGPALSSAMIRCFAWASLSAICATGALSLSLRRSVPSGTALRGGLTGAAAGAWAGAVMVIHCSSSDRAHILAAHALPIVLFAALGASLLPRWLRP